MKQGLSAQEATELLGVTRATLYAYVSRGLIRSEPGSDRTRAKRYSTDDVQRLIVRREQRLDPEKPLQTALDWGLPILDSELTLIRDGRLYYRGHDATLLAQHASVEEVAGLLWTGRQEAVRLPLKAKLAHLPLLPGVGLIERLEHALTTAAAQDLQAGTTEPGSAARVLALLVAVVERDVSLPAAPDLPLHRRLGRAWTDGSPEMADLLRRTLILIADHELNISSFTARCVTSAGASLHHALLAALCALQGGRHGLATEQSGELLEEAERLGAERALALNTRRRDGLPGFGHRLYPDGDPRALALLGHLQVHWPHARAVQTALELQQVVQRELGARPNIDLALATVNRLTNGSPRRGVALFALGRSVGWLAHGIESAQQGRLIRPRSRYVGLGPVEENHAADTTVHSSTTVG